MITMESMQVVELPVGTRLEKYELLEVLGQGGGGISYLAKDCQLKREVVLKEHFPLGLCRREKGTAEVLPTDAAGYEYSLSAFCRGARMLAGLQHESVVKVHEIFSACGTAFLVMDYVKGVSLREWMATRPTQAEMVHLLELLLTALEYVHREGVIHRDIKPSNIMVKEGNKPVIIDFDTSMPELPTHTPTPVGTPGYAAPEQFEKGSVPGPQADIYALGRSLSAAARDAGLKLPAAIRRSLQKACAEQQELRYCNATEWRLALKSAQRRPILATTGGLFAVAVAAGAGYAVLSDSEYITPAPSPVAESPVEVTEQAAVAETPSTKQAPIYHPIQLVNYNRSGKLYRYSPEKLPLAEEEFVSSLLKAQQVADETFARLNVQRREGTLKLRAYYRAYYNAQNELNMKIVALIDDFIARHYRGIDPHPLYTNLLKRKVSTHNLSDVGALLAVHATHPVHLISYDEQGNLVPQLVRGTQNEVLFGQALQEIQREFQDSLKQAEGQGEEARIELQRRMNQRVLDEIDKYIAEYIDEEHPEFFRTEALRQEVLNKNLPPELHNK